MVPTARWHRRRRCVARAAPERDVVLARRAMRSVVADGDRFLMRFNVSQTEDPRVTTAARGHESGADKA